jgi:hypothetical protein
MPPGISKDQCFLPVIPATQKVEMGGLRSKAGQGKNFRPYLKSKLNATGLGGGRGVT